LGTPLQTLNKKLSMRWPASSGPIVMSLTSARSPAPGAFTFGDVPAPENLAKSFIGNV
jgi:hypothetical protein